MADVGYAAAQDIPPGLPSPLPAETDPLALSNAFVERFGGRPGIQHMKLQKLAYYTHAWWLSRFETPFLNERPQVWKFGPVFEELYHDLKGFGSVPIVTPQPDHDTPFDPPPTIDGIAQLNQLIDWIWARYGHLSAEALSERTHAPGTPWKLIAERNGYRVPRHTEIDDNTIKRCFRGNVAEVLRRQ